MTASFRAWAMRTSRNTFQHKEYVRKQLDHGILRQGWGYEPGQDLRTIRDALNDRQLLSDHQKFAWGHWKMLGEGLGRKNEGICLGDIVLVPNMPGEGYFTLCRVTGEYDYAIDADIGDLGHFRPVDVLTPGGVSNTYPLVSEGLRRSLRCRSRLWWIGDSQTSIDAILAQAEKDGSQLRQGSDHVSRARLAVRSTLREGLDNLTAEITEPLRKNLQAAEWEPVLAQALKPLMRDVQVIHTGGPAEQGADLEIHVPNPFEPGTPWIIVVQVKDYSGMISADVALQLEEAIRTRRDEGTKGGRLVGVILASIQAAPSKELEDRLRELEVTYSVPISCVSGSAVMRAIAQGLFMGYRDQPSD